MRKTKKSENMKKANGGSFRGYAKHLKNCLRYLDKKDEDLSPKMRARKWMLAITAMFVLFCLSFFWMPQLELKQNAIKPIETRIKEKPNAGDTMKSFDLPIDSFKQQLIETYDEKFPKKQ